MSNAAINPRHESIFSLPMHKPLAPLESDVPEQKQEYLPFTVRVVQNEQDLLKAVRLRHSAYSRHIAELANHLQEPEANDWTPGTIVLLAESKLDGSALGTMRIQTNRFEPLALEHDVALPDWLQNQGMAEATRLGVTQAAAGRLVKTVLFKAYYLYCIENNLPYMVITARAPIDRQYDRLLFKDVYPNMGYMPMPHVFNLPHRLMYLNAPKAKAAWDSTNHPLTDFMVHTNHPDINFNEAEYQCIRTSPIKWDAYSPAQFQKYPMTTEVAHFQDAARSRASMRLQ
jgi:hypothetical protein